MHRLPLPFTLSLALLACTPSGGGGGDCRDDDPCANGFVCAAVSADVYECRPPCNDGACPIGQICDPFFEACIPGEGAPETDRGMPLDAGPGGRDASTDGGRPDFSPTDVIVADARIIDALPDVGADPDAFVDRDAFVEPDPDAFIDRDAFVDPDPDGFIGADGFVGSDAFIDRDGFVDRDAAAPLALLDGDWRFEVALLSDNPVPLLLRLRVAGDRSPVLNAVAHFCDGEPCDDLGFSAVDESTNDIEVQIDGERITLTLFGGLPLTAQSSPYGEALDLIELTLDGQLIDQDLICGVTDVRLLFEGAEPFEIERAPTRLIHVGQWALEAPDLNTILGCGE